LRRVATPARDSTTHDSTRCSWRCRCPGEARSSSTPAVCTGSMRPRPRSASSTTSMPGADAAPDVREATARIPRDRLSARRGAARVRRASRRPCRRVGRGRPEIATGERLLRVRATWPSASAKQSAVLAARPRAEFKPPRDPPALTRRLTRPRMVVDLAKRGRVEASLASNLCGRTIRRS